MPQFSDDIFLGPVFAPNPRDPNAPSSPMNGLGPMGRVHVYDIVPATLAANNIALAQIAVALALTAGAGVTTRVGADQQSTQLVLDVPRNVRVTAAGANTATATVRGFDQYGQPMTETYAAPSTSTVSGKKAFKVISSVTMSGTPGSNITVGTGDVFGLPFVVSDLGYILSNKWAGAIAQDAGTALVADGAAATGTTGDVRGTYAPSSASNGARRLVVAMAATGSQVGPNATRLAALGVTQFAG